MTHDDAVVAAPTSLNVVVLAAGKSSRMGTTGSHKLLARFGGTPLVRRSTLIACDCDCQSVFVVTGHRHLEIQQVIADLDIGVVYNPDYRSGIASSIRSGVEAAEVNNPQGILLMLADMPLISVDALNSLIAAFRSLHGVCIVRAVAQGMPGNPVIFPAALYGDLKCLSGDLGARSIVAKSKMPVINVEIGDGARLDVDTPDQVIAAGGLLA